MKQTEITKCLLTIAEQQTKIMECSSIMITQLIATIKGSRIQPQVTECLLVMAEQQANIKDYSLATVEQITNIIKFLQVKE